MLLPIKFKTKLNIKNMSSAKALDVIEKYFHEQSYNYIKRHEDKIIFHKANLWSTVNFKSFLVSRV